MCTWDLRVGPGGLKGGPKCRSQSGMSPVRVAQRWPHSQLCAGWLGRSGTTASCGVDRPVTMAEGNTVLYGSQREAASEQYNPVGLAWGQKFQCEW